MKNQFSQELIDTQGDTLIAQNNIQYARKDEYQGLGKKNVLVGVSIVIGLMLAISVGVVLTQTPRDNVVPSWQLNGKTQFYSQDQICVQQGNNQTCTQIKANTTTVTIDNNDETTTNLILLNHLSVSQPNGNEQVYQQNVSVINKKQPQFTCQDLSYEECQQLNKIPLLTFIVDKSTGQVTQVGVPEDVDDIFIQTLTTNILHLGPNVQEAEQTNQGVKNQYQVGKLAFMPKRTIQEYWGGQVEITKKITQDDSLNGNGVLSFFEKFSQNQTTFIDSDNNLVESHISVNTTIDTSIRAQNPQYQNKEAMTYISDQSDLIAVNSTQDEYLTQVLKSIQSQQKLQYFTIQSLQDRIFKTKNQKRIKIEPEQEQVNRNLLGLPTQSVCANNKININSQETVVQADVMNKEVGLQTKIKGTGTNDTLDATFKACITVNNICVHTLYTDTVDYNGTALNINQHQWSDIHNQTLFDELFQADLLIIGFTASAGGSFTYGVGTQQALVSNSTYKGIQEIVYATVVIETYAEVDIDYAIGLRAGVVGQIFQGDLTAEILFAYNPTTNEINLKQNEVSLYANYDILKVNVYLQWQHLTTTPIKLCFDVTSWLEVCLTLPLPDGITDWLDIYNNSFAFRGLEKHVQIFQIQSQCFNQ